MPSPCSEKWDAFTPTFKGRFCGSCKKEVIDFTHWNEEQIKRYFTQLSTSTCGRFTATQLKTYETAPRPKQQWWAASALALMLIAAGRTEAQPKQRALSHEQINEKKSITTPQRPDSAFAHVVFRGIVRNSLDGSGLPGVNVLRKGSKQGIVTDGEGKFEMIIDHPQPTEQLVFSFIGFATQEKEIRITPMPMEIIVQMQYDIMGLTGEIVVLGGVQSFHPLSPRRLWWKVKYLFSK